MKKLIIAVDCDDVLVPTASMLIAYYNRTYGTQIELKDFYSNNLDVWGVKDDITARNRVDAYHETDEYQNAKPFAEAIEAMHEDVMLGETGDASRLKRRMVERVLTRCERSALGDIEPLMTLLRRFATEAAREEARMFCDELVDIPEPYPVEEYDFVPGDRLVAA